MDKDERKEYMKLYYVENKDKLISDMKKYQEENKEEQRKYRREYYREYRLKKKLKDDGQQ